MTNITIPPEALEALRKSITDAVIYITPEEAHAAALALLEAWPGAFPWTFKGPLDGTGYVLPLTTQENENG